MIPVLHRLSRARRRLRLALWAARTRTVLRGAGCALELVMADDVTFVTLPRIEATLQRLGEEARGAGGRVRIELGPGVHLGRDATFEVLPSADAVIVLGRGTTLGAGVRLIAFGGELRIGPWSRLRDGATVKSSGRLTTGEHLIVQSWSMLHCALELTIGDRVTLGERVSVLDSDHQADGSDVWTQRQPLATAPVVLEPNTWIGANAVILRGVTLRRNAVVAAGSVVRAGDYEAGWLIAGSPAEAKRPLGAVAKAAGTDSLPGS